jgi:hypothetical protein
MSLYYSHLLIARDKDFSASPVQVAAFGNALDSLGVVPPPFTITLSTESNRFRTVQNPFTGEDFVFQERDRHPLSGLEALPAAIATLADYWLYIAGTGQPRTPPLPIVFDGPYHVCITIQRHADLRCTSYCSGEPERVPCEFGKPYEAFQSVGYFTNPHDGSTIAVPEASCARFWIEIQLGKFLCPPIENDRLDFLNGEVVSAASECFGITFAQGCIWG